MLSSLHTLPPSEPSSTRPRLSLRGFFSVNSVPGTRPVLIWASKSPFVPSAHSRFDRDFNLSVTSTPFPPPVTVHQSQTTKPFRIRTSEKHAPNPFRIRTSEKHAPNPFRIRTSKTQYLKFFRMNTSEKTGRGRVRRRTNLSPFRYEKIPTISERLDQIHHLLAEKHWEDCKRQKPFRVEYEVHNVQFVK